jgi:thiosulfate/3-mercaptopyruvate sulfurtransferase
MVAIWEQILNATEEMKISRLLTGEAIGVVCLLFACVREDSGLSALQVRSNMLVTTSWLNLHLNNPELTILHVAEGRSGYERGHIPGALFVAWSDIAVTREGVPDELPTLSALIDLIQRLHIREERHAPGMSDGIAQTFIGIVGGYGIGDGSRIVIYDEEEGAMAAQAYVALDYMGLGERAALLDGHLRKWKSESKTLTKDEHPAAPSAFTPRLRPGVVLSMLEVRDMVDEKQNFPEVNVAIVDARPEAEYLGSEAGRGVSRPGHIPGAVNVPWRSHIVRRDIPVLQPVKKMRATYGAAGLDPRDLAVVYARTGAEAAHSYFALKYLGFDVCLYDGSYVEWNMKGEAVEVKSTD